MAKQTFTVGQVLTAAQLTNLQQTAMLGGAASAKTASYTLVAADAGTTISMTSTSATTVTVNTGLFAAGDTVFIQNLGTGNLTITAGSATVATAGSLILPQNDAGILYFVSTSSSVFYDFIQAGAVSPLTTKGDLYTFSTSDARLGVGANGTVLTAASGQATGLEWATPASGGMTLISTTSISGVSTTLSSIPQTYSNLQLIISGLTWDTSDAIPSLRLNGGSSPGVSYSGTRGGGFMTRGNSEFWWIDANWTRTDANNVVTFNFINYANTTVRKTLDYFGACETTNYRGYEAGGIWHETGALTSIQIYVEGRNITAGTALLYGVK